MTGAPAGGTPREIFTPEGISAVLPRLPRAADPPDKIVAIATTSARRSPMDENNAPISLPVSNESANIGRESAPRHAAPARRTLLQGLGMAGMAALSSRLLVTPAEAVQAAPRKKPSAGDIAILRFLAAAELIEADLWLQYAELGGIATGTPNPYQAAFDRLDGDSGQYITSNTIDEQSHAQFLNAYLASVGADPVNLDRFRTLPSSKATGAQQIGRLTNLMQLSVDTSWYVRYRSTTNPDFGETYPQALPALAAGQFPAIPRDDSDFGPADHIQAIANTAAFHFGAIEQGGTSLYASMSQRVSSAEVLEITLGIGGDEICHFLEWVDFAGNGVQKPVAPLTDPTNGLTFPNFIAEANPLIQPNLIFPVPCGFISPDLPACAVIRPFGTATVTAVGAINSFAASGLFIGQSQAFMNYVLKLAAQADRARRTV
jgi:hypothetical protein